MKGAYEKKPIYRNELKQYINIGDYIILRNRLEVICSKDKHAQRSGKYKIRSLYFETPDDKALREKLDGVNNREKFRLRYYDDDFSFIKLEKKSKSNGYGNKITAPVTKEECERIISGDIEWMKKSGRALLLELYGKIKGELLMPKTIVDYTREPYVYAPGNVRITIDSNIRTGIYSKDFLNSEVVTLSPLMADPIILEVKFDNFLPEIIRGAVQLGNRRSTAFSKYAVCRMYG